MGQTADTTDRLVALLGQPAVDSVAARRLALLDECKLLTTEQFEARMNAATGPERVNMTAVAYVLAPEHVDKPTSLDSTAKWRDLAVKCGHWTDGALHARMQTVEGTERDDLIMVAVMRRDFPRSWLPATWSDGTRVELW